MKFLAIDDEPMALRDLCEALSAAVPNSEIIAFSAPSKALEQAKDTAFHVAFLDVEMGSMSGLVVAKQLKDLQPDIHIIFVTSHDKYAVDAFRIHAVGYLMKPVFTEDILRELTFLYGEEIRPQRKVTVQTFGGFDIFVHGKPLAFRRSRAKELLALLIDRRGVSMTIAEVCAILWEEEPTGISQKSYLRTIVTELKTTLQEAGLQDILIKRRNSLAIVPESLDCDSYRFFDGDPQAVNSYRHNYLPNYSWAEFSIPFFENFKH